MSQQNTPNYPCDVTVQIFNSFLAELTITGIPIDRVNCLRKLLEEKNYSERALKTAIIEEEQPQ